MLSRMGHLALVREHASDARSVAPRLPEPAEGARPGLGAGPGSRRREGGRAVPPKRAEGAHGRTPRVRDARACGGPAGSVPRPRGAGRRAGARRHPRATRARAVGPARARGRWGSRRSGPDRAREGPPGPGRARLFPRRRWVLRAPACRAGGERRAAPGPGVVRENVGRHGASPCAESSAKAARGRLVRVGARKRAPPPPPLPSHHHHHPPTHPARRGRAWALPP